MDLFAEYYLPLKVLHVMAFMSWMAMLFYLPRLFVYHAEFKDKKEFTKVVEIQERLLYKAIGFPAFVLTLISGILLILANPSVMTSGGWMHVKLLLLVFLTAYSFSLEYYRKQLLNGTCKRSGKFFRAYNEVPTYLSLLIVTFVVMKDFYPIYTIIVTIIFVVIYYVVLKHNPMKKVTK
ncbi:MAG: protoporphyrinogen oxidase HemJ [Campylobacteraceae bacterium]